MAENYREIIDELLYLISEDIYNLLDKDGDDIEDAIFFLAKKVNKISDDIYEDEIVYERPEGKADFKFSLQ